MVSGVCICCVVYENDDTFVVCFVCIFLVIFNLIYMNKFVFFLCMKNIRHFVLVVSLSLYVLLVSCEVSNKTFRLRDLTP